NPTPYADYPNPAATDVKLYLGKGGNSAGTLQLVKSASKIKGVLVDDVAFSGKDLASAKQSDNRLLYVSPVLKQDLHISGIANISVKLAVNKPAANFSVWLAP